jgi:hypothetical protein
MAGVCADPVHMVSYFTIGFLFFVIIWNFVGGIMKDILPSTPGMILTFCIASYGFWHPLFSPLRILYLGFLMVVVVCGSAFSRANIVIISTHKGRHMVVVTIMVLILFEVVYAVISHHYAKTEYRIVVSCISWCLLVYGILRNNLIGMVIMQTPLPWKKYLYAAFVLACIIFLPVEYPAIYYLVSVGGIVGIGIGSLFALRSGV